MQTQNLVLRAQVDRTGVKMPWCSKPIEGSIHQIQSLNSPWKDTEIVYARSLPFILPLFSPAAHLPMTWLQPSCHDCSASCSAETIYPPARMASTISTNQAQQE
jgi:hypothetical protein